MATLFKSGNAYKLQFVAKGKRRTLAAGRYKLAAEKLQANVQDLLDLAANGREPDGDLRTWLEGMGEGMRRKLIAWGMLAGLGVAGTEPIAKHVTDYLDACRGDGQASKHVHMKERYLRLVVEAAKAERLADLRVEAVQDFLDARRKGGTGARDANYCRGAVVSFVNWCVKRGRISSNPLSDLRKEDEAQDRRRIRRALTDDELSRLLAVAPEHRRAFYLAAALAGLRRGDMRGIVWGNVDLAGETVTIPAAVGKAKREDVIPLHPQLAAALAEMRPPFAGPADRVWPRFPTNVTRLKDFLRAGLARTVYTGPDGVELSLAQAQAMRKAARQAGQRSPVCVRIITTDPEGRVIDLHALRTTLGTQLARAGTAPQVAMKIMRHANYQTTLKHYTVLGLADTAAAVGRLPNIPTTGQADDVRALATGTDAAESIPSAANGAAKSCVTFQKTRHSVAVSDGMIGGEMGRGGVRETAMNTGENTDLQGFPLKAGDRIRTGDHLLGRQRLYH